MNNIIVNAIKIFSKNINGYSELKVRGYVQEAWKNWEAVHLLSVYKKKHI